MAPLTLHRPLALMSQLACDSTCTAMPLTLIVPPALISRSPCAFRLILLLAVSIVITLLPELSAMVIDPPPLESSRVMVCPLGDWMMRLVTAPPPSTTELLSLGGLSWPFHSPPRMKGRWGSQCWKATRNSSLTSGNQ